MSSVLLRHSALVVGAQDALKSIAALHGARVVRSKLGNNYAALQLTGKVSMVSVGIYMCAYTHIYIYICGQWSVLHIYLYI